MNKDKVRKLIIDELDLHPQHPFWYKFEVLHPTVSNEEVEEALKDLEEYIENNVECSYQNVMCTNERVKEVVKETQYDLLNTIKQALTTPKISEDDLEFILKWAKIGIWQEREKRFNIMRRIKNSSTLSCYKIIIKELNSNYDRIKTLKSIGGNR